MAFLKNRHTRSLLFWHLIFSFLFILIFILKANAEKIIPNSLIAMQTNKAIDHVLLVEKESQKLYVYAYDGQFRELKRYQCSTGENKGSKKQSGDRKTPEGVYFFNNRFTKRDLTPIYGTRAFPIDYPNYMDRFAGKNGSAIWVHGTNKKLKDRDTNGCVAMINKDIDELDKYIDLHHTPIIIQKKIKYVHPNENEPIRISLIQFMRTIENLMMFGDSKSYFSHYNYISDYIPKWWTTWEELRNEIKSNFPEASIKFNKIILLKHDRIYVALFDLNILTGTLRRAKEIKKIDAKAFSAGKKKFFIVHYKDKWRIVGEEYQTATVRKDQNYPLIAAATNIVNKTTLIASRPRHVKKQSVNTQKQQKINKEELSADRKEIQSNISQMVDKWLEAWQSKNIDQYGNYYAKDFRSKGKNRQQWLNYKKYLNKKYDFIKLDRKELKFQFYRKYKDRVKVYFEQTYKSNLYVAKGKKTLILKNEDGQWKIYREYWNKI